MQFAVTYVEVTDMAIEPRSSPGAAGLPEKHVLAIAIFCFFIGLVAGYFLLGRPNNPVLARTQPSSNATSPGVLRAPHPSLTLEQMKQMADVQASTLIEKSKADSSNAGLLVQIATIYQTAHQFKVAAGYFERALEIDPKNVGVRTQLAACFYHSGDADGALKELAESLKYDPADRNSLFNLGMIRYRGKNDPEGAIAAWQQLLKKHPDLDRKAEVEAMIAEAQGSLAGKK